MCFCLVFQRGASCSFGRLEVEEEGGGMEKRGATTIYPDNQLQCLPPPPPTPTVFPHPINYACFYYPSSSSSGAGQWPANSYSLMCVFTVIMTHNAWTIYTSVCTKKKQKSLTVDLLPTTQMSERNGLVWALRFLFLTSFAVCRITMGQV